MDEFIIFQVISNIMLEDDSEIWLEMEKDCITKIDIIIKNYIGDNDEIIAEGADGLELKISKENMLKVLHKSRFTKELSVSPVSEGKTLANFDHNKIIHKLYFAFDAIKEKPTLKRLNITSGSMNKLAICRLLSDCIYHVLWIDENISNGRLYDLYNQPLTPVKTLKKIRNDYKSFIDRQEVFRYINLYILGIGETVDNRKIKLKNILNQLESELSNCEQKVSNNLDSGIYIVERLSFFTYYYCFLADIINSKIADYFDSRFTFLLMDTLIYIMEESYFNRKKIITTKQNIGKKRTRQRKTIDCIKASLKEYSNEKLKSIAAIEKPYTRAAKIQIAIQKYGDSCEQKTIVRNWNTAWEELKVERGIETILANTKVLKNKKN